jgi:Tol biopolymer transport system component
MDAILSPVRRAAALLGAVLLAACGDSTGSSSLNVSLEGAAERSAEVTVIVTRNGTAVEPSALTLSVQPADAAQVLAPNRLRLLRVGALTVTAQAYGKTKSVRVDVERPPVVVFDRLADGNRDIWSVALDGGDLTRLTTAPGDDLDPTAGGGKVVFVTYRNAQADLYAVSLAGGAETPVTTAGSNETAPALSPDGQRLAFTRDATGVSKLWSARGDGTNAAVATTNFGFGGSIDASPAWAPTGGRVAFVSTANGSADLYAVEPVGTPTLLVGGAAADVEPAWSPDGTRVAFASDRDGGDTEIWMLTVGTGALTRLTNRAGTDAQPTWLPDGRLVYVAFNTSTSQLRWLDPANPGVTHAIDTGAGPALRPAAVPD